MKILNGALGVVIITLTFLNYDLREKEKKARVLNEMNSEVNDYVREKLRLCEKDRCQCHDKNGNLSECARTDRKCFEGPRRMILIEDN